MSGNQAASSYGAKVTPIRVEPSPMDRPRRKRMPWLFIGSGALVLLLVAVAAGYFAFQQRGSYVLREDDISISTVERSAFVDFIAVRGVVTPDQTIALSSPATGQIENVFVRSGDLVAAGTSIVRLSNTVMELDVLSREAQAVEQMNSQRSLQVSLSSRMGQNALEAAEVGHRIEQLALELFRAERLAETGTGTAARRDEVQMELEFQQSRAEILTEAASRDAKIASEIGVSFARSEELLAEVAARRRSQLEALTIKAPRDGQVNGLTLTVGEQVAAGAALGSIDVPGSNKIVFQADEFHLPRVSVGQRVLALIAGSERELLVSSVSNRVQDGLFQFEAEFQGQQSDGLIRGQAVSGRLMIGQGNEEALVLPVGSFLEQSGGRFVFVIGDDGLARKAPVSLGRRTNESVEVLSGLDEGAQVITSGYGLIADYDVVEIR